MATIALSGSDTITINNHPINTYIFVSLVVVGVLPCSHWAMITPDFYRSQLYTGAYIHTYKYMHTYIQTEHALNPFLCQFLVVEREK